MANPAYRRQGVSPTRAVSPQRAAPVAQYDPYAPQLGYLSENIHRLLTERECSIFDRGLADYHRRRNIRAFVECLSLVLNTNQKRQLLLPIRDTYIKPTDFAKFNQLVQTHGLATSLRKKKKDEEKSKDVRKLDIRRDAMEEWGFNIRGGAEHGLGIFVSWVDPGSAAQRAGLHAGDQILKANELNCEQVSHYEAVKLIKNTKRLKLWVLSHGRVPSSHMANKVYRWVDPDGRPTTPPPDPFEVQDQVSKGDHNLLSDADERKVTIMVDSGQELGISIRGGAEHGLGVYISFVEEGSVAEAYGLKVGDQILEVNGVNFLGIVHSDAANALRAQPCMVMRIKDVGKLPHSRITTYGQTKWQAQSPTDGQKWSSQRDEPPSPAFRSGVGTQVMLKQDTSIQGRGMMNEVARSVLSSQELATFNYYIHQYEHYNLPVDDLVMPLLDLFDTKEKIQLIAEVRAIIKPHDLQRYNELTVHKEIAAKKAVKRNINGSIDDLVSKLSTQHSPKLPSSFNQHQNSGTIELHPISNGINNSGRDTVPHKLSPQRAGGPVFHIPPPPTSSQPKTSTPGSHNGTDPQRSLTSSLQDRRQWMTSGADETGNGQWNETSMMSSIQPPSGKQDNLPEIEARIRAETESKLRQQFEEQQQRLLEEQQQRLADEQREKELTLSRERETLERQLKEMEERVKAEVEEKERLLAEDPSKASQNDPAEIEERIKQDLEEKIWREAEEHMRQEFEHKLEQEKQSLVPQPTGQSEANKQDIEERVRKEVEEKLKREYQEKIRQEEQKWKRKEQEERRKKEEEQRLKREAEIKRLEEEEQARIELEERIRKEAEAKARAEYEARLQHETEERARLAEEVKARKALEERMKMQNAQQQDDEDDEEEEAQPSNEQELEEQRRLEEQRMQREREKREEERRIAQQRKAAEDERKKREDERQKRLELERKREENLRRKVQEKQHREAEEKKRREEEARKQAQQRQAPPKKTETKTKEQIVADERRKAEEKLQRRLKKAQEKKQAEPIEETESGPPARTQQQQQRQQQQQPPPAAAIENKNPGQSYAGYDNLHGTILNITVTKVSKRLGIAIDGGANTKQKAVIIREISPGGCAAQTGLGMSVGQQILSVDGQSLYGLKHKDVVMAIKSAFEGPLNKTIEFAILEPDE